MKGSTKAKVHDVFKDRLDDLKAKGKKVAEGFTATGQREWYIPEALEAETLFDIAQLHKPVFDREEINTNYVECFQDPESPGTVADIISLNHQQDYNAAEERAFRFRHASPCRLLAHAMCRRYFHDTGPVFEYLRQVEEDIIAAGGV